MSVVIEKIDRPVDAVGEFPEAVPEPPLRKTDQFVHDPADGFRSVPLDDLEKSPLGHVVGGDHGPEVQAHHERETGHREDHAPDVIPDRPSLDQLDGGNDHGLLNSFGRLRAPASRVHAAHVDLVGAGPHPGEQLSVDEDGGDDGDVRRMKGALVGVVDDEHVSVFDPRIFRAVPQGVLDDLGHGARVQDDLVTHLDDGSISQIQAGIEIVGFGHDG